MTHLVYDGSFEGLLTAIFEVYEYKFSLATIVTKDRFQPGIFDKKQLVNTDQQKAERVWKGLKQKLSAHATAQFYKTYLGEEKELEQHLLAYAQYAFSRPQSIEGDFAHSAVLYVSQMAKKVSREKHRMEAFVRFQLLKDNIYYATIQPDYNVLPLIEKHFEERYADQQWIIYDVQRKFGLHYDLLDVHLVEIDFEEGRSPTETTNAVSESEPLYQMLWQQYFSSVNIAERKNTRLHIQHMPRRYWKYLPEKQ